MIDKILLFPYYLILKARDRRYSKKGRKFFYPEVPSICVGNVTVGGTGKTPHTEMILRMLGESENWGSKHIAVLSRGYMRESKGFQQVTREGSASMFGDEPLQIKKKFPDVTVAVDKNRIEGCGILCHPEKLNSKKFARQCWNRDFPAADYIVLDDAYQYRRLKAAADIVLVDYNNPVHKDMLLPLGRLRDLPGRVADADVVIITKSPQEIEPEQKERFVAEMGIKDYNPFRCEGVSAHGKTQLVLFTYVHYCQGQCVYKTTDPRFMYSKKLILVTGIAKDTALRNYLSDTYKIVKRLSFPDHHKYVWSDINKIQDALKKHPTASIATTEKDVQRLLDFNGMPQELMERMFYVPIETAFTTEEEKTVFREFIDNVG